MKKELLKEKLKLKEVELSDEPAFVKITCPSCSSEIPAADINIHDKIAKCNHCASVFPFQTDLAVFKKGRTALVQNIDRPEGIDVFHFDDRHEITVSQPMTDLEIITMFIFSTFTVVFFILYLKQGLPLIYSLGSGFALLAYLFSFINHDKHKIYIDIDHQSMHVKWRPKKFKTDLSFHVNDIKQLYVKQQELYMIVDGLGGAKHIRLIRGLTSQTKVHFLEQEIERYLGIPNEVVVGEDPSNMSNS